MHIRTSDDMSPFDFDEGEVLLVDKPVHWTSFDVVNKIRNTIRPKKLKVGHAGTLDPLATGLLIICTGKNTKKIDGFQAQHKEYTGTFTLGATRPSYDMETEIDQTFPYEHLKEEEILEAVKHFIGEIDQYPPIHSAIKQNGERVYEKARRGEEVEMKSRRVEIFEMEITRVALPEVDFRILCSKGTYIRSIAHDFGKIINSGAYLSNLRRTKSGEFSVDKAWELTTLIEWIQEANKLITNESI